MIYHLLYPWHDTIILFNVFKYISLRTIYASITALLICFLVGPWLITKLQRMRLGQEIRPDGPESHHSKRGTPTMGGIMILFSVMTSTLLWANLTNSYIWVALAVMLFFGAIGFVDDYKKIAQKSSTGMTAKSRLAMEIMVALAVGVFLVAKGFPTTLALPFFKKLVPDLGVFYVLLVVLVIVGCANAVNLTDGLDGLAIGPIIICSLTYLLLAYFAGHREFAGYLLVPFVNGAGELSVFCGALVGAGIGFLWFNAYPAQVFMGDVGSLSLGGALGALAIMTKQEVLLVIIGGLFVMEAISVILQVSWFKLSRGERIFRMAPLHHHFELGGWAEPKVIVRFWIISILLALLAISTLKLR